MTAGGTAGAQPPRSAVSKPSTGLPLEIKLVWSASYPKDHAPFALSSPVVADVKGGRAVVVGDRSGHVYAVYLTPNSKGQARGAWEVTAHGPNGVVGIDSSPSTYDGVVYFGVGWRGQRGVGGYEAIKPNGLRMWLKKSINPPGDPGDVGVSAGLSLGILQSQTTVVGPSQGQNTYLLQPSNGKTLKGFPWFQADTVFATPAIADVRDNGQNQIIEDGNTTAGHAYHTSYINGGQVRILKETGNGGNAKQPNDGMYCQFTTNQGADSSPAVGDILAGGKPGIVFGTSTERANRSETDQLMAINGDCRLQWRTTLNGATTPSPAFADVMGNDQLQVVEGTQNGWVYALNSETGKILWSNQMPRGIVLGGVVTADLGNGRQDVIVPTTSGVYILDGKTGKPMAILDDKTGKPMATLEGTVGLQNSPLVTDDPNGTIGITIAGYSGSHGESHAVMQHYEIVGSHGSVVTENGAWPEFHHDPQLTGNADIPSADNLAMKANSLPKAKVGVHYSVVLQASGGVGPYTWSRVGGSKPPGMSLLPGGRWVGMPTRPGTYRIPVQVSDRRGTRVKATIVLKIAA
jgi:outer membrane protein assembly factor BamB